jgi:hypothetical protein
MQNESQDLSWLHDTTIYEVMDLGGQYIEIVYVQDRVLMRYNSGTGKTTEVAQVRDESIKQLIPERLCVVYNDGIQVVDEYTECVTDGMVNISTGAGQLCIADRNTYSVYEKNKLVSKRDLPKNAILQQRCPYGQIYYLKDGGYYRLEWNTTRDTFICNTSNFLGSVLVEEYNENGQKKFMLSCNNKIVTVAADNIQSITPREYCILVEINGISYALGYANVDHIPIRYQG